MLIFPMRQWHFVLVWLRRREVSLILLLDVYRCRRGAVCAAHAYMAMERECCYQSECYAREGFGDDFGDRRGLELDIGGSCGSGQRERPEDAERR